VRYAEELLVVVTDSIKMSHDRRIILTRAILLRTAAELSRRASLLYGDAQGFGAKTQIWRPFICPFEVLLDLIPEGSTILDVGCGAGLWLALLADAGRIRSGSGFDSSGNAIDLAKRAAAKLTRPIALSFQLGDILGAWPDATFQAVSLIDVLHHIPVGRREYVLDQAIRHTSPGGVLLVKEMATRPAYKAWCNQLHDLLLARQWIEHIPAETIDAWARSEKLTCVDSGSASRLWYAHEWRVFQRPPTPCS
jgi:2-polyprenyl-3-methyl-5-hydroxy-6-metoxy-1,4-benzoquinol methylase